MRIKTKVQRQKWCVYETSNIIGVEVSCWRVIERWNVHTDPLGILLKHILCLGWGSLNSWAFATYALSSRGVKPDELLCRCGPDTQAESRELWKESSGSTLQRSWEETWLRSLCWSWWAHLCFEPGCLQGTTGLCGADNFSWGRVRLISLRSPHSFKS